MWRNTCNPRSYKSSQIQFTRDNGKSTKHCKRNCITSLEQRRVDVLVKYILSASHVCPGACKLDALRATLHVEPQVHINLRRCSKILKIETCKWCSTQQAGVTSIPLSLYSNPTACCSNQSITCPLWSLVPSISHPCSCKYCSPPRWHMRSHQFVLLNQLHEN